MSKKDEKMGPNDGVGGSLRTEPHWTKGLLRFLVLLLSLFLVLLFRVNDPIDPPLAGQIRPQVQVHDSGPQ